MAYGGRLSIQPQLFQFHWLKPTEREGPHALVRRWIYHREHGGTQRTPHIDLCEPQCSLWLKMILDDAGTTRKVRPADLLSTETRLVHHGIIAANSLTDLLRKKCAEEEAR